MSYQKNLGYIIDQKWLRTHDTELNDIWSFSITESTDNEQKIKELSEILNTVGFSVHLYAAETSHVLIISMDKDKYALVTNRGAGRKKSWNYKQNPTIAQINELREKGWKNRQIIEWIGCSESNFYKYMRKAKKIKADPEEHLFDL